MRTGRLWIVATACGASLAFTASAAAATIQVTDPGDPPGTVSTCTLRQAIVSANTDSNTGSNCTPGSGSDQITFAPAAVAPLALTSELPISSDLDIVGPGMSSLTISGDISVRVFNVTAGTVTISGLTVTGGNPGPSGNFAEGGCILNAGTLTLNEIRVTDCTAALTGNAAIFADGGGIANTGTLDLENSLVDHNHGSANVVSDTTHQAAVRGAGIFSEGSGLTIDNSTISDNDATATTPGGNFANAEAGIEATGPFDISHSTLAGNSAVATQASGAPLAVGALTVAAGLGNLELSTIAGNTADPSPLPSSVAAGGIFLELATFNVRSSTIALNGPTSVTADGATLTVADGGTATVSNSILAGPRGGGKNCTVISGTIGSAGFNDDNSPAGASCFTPPMASDLTANPLLSAAGLASNGGPTQTIALQPTSPMIDAGSNAGDTDATHDQRGLTRPVDFSGIPNAANGTDIGAFEVQATCAGQSTPGGACPAPPSPAPPVTHKKSKCKKHKKGKKASYAKKKKCKKKKGKK